MDVMWNGVSCELMIECVVKVTIQHFLLSTLLLHRPKRQFTFYFVPLYSQNPMDPLVFQSVQKQFILVFGR